MRTRNRIKEKRIKVSQACVQPTFDPDFIEDDYRKVWQLLGIDESVSSEEENSSQRSSNGCLTKKAVNQAESELDTDSITYLNQVYCDYEHLQKLNLDLCFDHKNLNFGWETNVTTDFIPKESDQGQEEIIHSVAVKKRDEKFEAKSKAWFEMFCNFINQLHISQDSEVISLRSLNKNMPKTPTK